MPGAFQLSERWCHVQPRVTQFRIFCAFRKSMRKARKKKEQFIANSKTYDLARKRRRKKMKFQAPKCIRLHKHVLASNCLPQLYQIRGQYLKTYAPTRNKLLVRLEFFFPLEKPLEIAFSFSQWPDFRFKCSYCRHFIHFRITFRRGFLNVTEEEKKNWLPTFTKNETYKKKCGIPKKAAQMTIVGWLKNAITAIVEKFSILNSIDCMCWIFCHFRFRYCVYGKIDAWFVCAAFSFVVYFYWNVPRKMAMLPTTGGPDGMKMTAVTPTRPICRTSIAKWLLFLRIVK